MAADPERPHFDCLRRFPDCPARHGRVGVGVADRLVRDPGRLRLHRAGVSAEAAQAAGLSRRRLRRRRSYLINCQKRPANRDEAQAVSVSTETETALGCLPRPDKSRREVSMNSGTPIPRASVRSRLFPVVATIVLAGFASMASAQQQVRQQPGRGEPAAPAKDYDQRALEIYEFRKAAQSGPARGREIYFYKCWMCHNELAQGGAPKLVGLFQRPTLVSGDPVNDDTVKAKILNGSANMPAYKHVLNEGDLADLMSWLRDEKCCWNSEILPLNPRYKGASAPARTSLYGSLSGGPKGLVKNARGEPIEGIMVQLIADDTAIRTTVYSRGDGRYEFPRVVPEIGR